MKTMTAKQRIISRKCLRFLNSQVVPRTPQVTVRQERERGGGSSTAFCWREGSNMYERTSHSSNLKVLKQYAIRGLPFLR